MSVAGEGEMGTVYLTTTADNELRPTSRDDYHRILESARLDRLKQYRLVEDPDEADLILFVGSLESDFWDVRRHPLVRRFPERCFLYHSEDHVFPFLPGVYPSIKSRDLSMGRAVSGGYTAVLHIPVPTMEFDDDAPYLFSFVGAFRTHPLRARLLALGRHPRGWIEDSSGRPAGEPLSSHAPGPHRDRYGQILGQSKFVLCPRGRGVSSWRLFETLRAGRVPVIVSDDWVAPPVKPAWSTFAIRVKESDIDMIPRILEIKESQAAGMAARARKVWEDWFSREVFFHRTVEWCRKIQRGRTMEERAARRIAYLRLFHPFNVRRYIVPRIRKTVMGVRQVHEAEDAT